MGDMEPKAAISCDQARPPMEGLGRQHIHITIDLQFVLPIGRAGVKVVQRLWEQPTNHSSSLRHMPRE